MRRLRGSLSKCFGHAFHSCKSIPFGDLLLLDEPFEGIDPVSTRNIKDLLLGLNRKGTTIVLTSHALDLVERLCPVLAIIEQGRLVGHGTLADLQAAHGESVSLEALFLRLMGGAKQGTLSWS